jgi:hypothetical protein
MRSIVISMTGDELDNFSFSAVYPGGGKHITVN